MFSSLYTVFSLLSFVIRVIIISLYETSRKWLFKIDPDAFPRIPRHVTVDNLASAKDISEIAAANGYIIREHVVTTRDNYLLVIHKLEKRDSSSSRTNSRRPTNTKLESKVAYFHHGLLTNSELFLLGSEKNKNLPYLLVDLGYEVWLGNNRGNKYSRKHLKLSVSDKRYWNYSLDEFALYDIPDTLNYIKSFYSYDKSCKIIYVGFSQGCSQLFASLSLNPTLNDSISLFVGLSPAIIPRDLNHTLLKVIVNQTANDNSFLYSLFGERAILPSVSFWCWLMGPELYQLVVDQSLQFLFGWSSKNISPKQKKVGYSHMFSNSSVKSIIHWFQIISSRRFQMFDETCNIGLSGLSTLSHDSKLTTSRVAPFPISHHLDVPMVLVYGDSDILVDIESTKDLILSQNSIMASKLLETIGCPTYEHMDTLWGDTVYETVFKKVIEYMENSHLYEDDRFYDRKEKETVNGKADVYLQKSNFILI
ncbi:sterol esterase Tgl1p [[Candida] railenensis]|uniref:Sterol esterase Tgl1p n=1 Tax=[Candida] railenensis TaxID=45579 RepID=A0A9P0QVX5_9ASCO|nr:sterol esterase Tgl1p [[Candida] railenensis]